MMRCSFGTHRKRFLRRICRRVMDFEDEDEEPKLKKYLEWIIMPALVILSYVAFGYSINGLGLLMKWNEQFIPLDEPQTTCDQLRQNRRKYEAVMQLTLEMDWVYTVCLGVCSVLLLLAFITARITDRKKHKTVCYTSICGFNCTLIILLSGTVALVVFLNRQEQLGVLNLINNDVDNQASPQLTALRIYIKDCVGHVTEDDENVEGVEFDESLYAWEDFANENATVKFSDCYKHCPMHNSKTVMILTIVLFACCFVFGSPVLFFIVRFWRPKKRNVDRYGHLDEMRRNDSQDRPDYVLNGSFLRTPSDYAFEFTGFHDHNYAY